MRGWEVTKGSHTKTHGGVGSCLTFGRRSDHNSRRVVRMRRRQNQLSRTADKSKGEALRVDRTRLDTFHKIEPTRAWRIRILWSGKFDRWILWSGKFWKMEKSRRVKLRWRLGMRFFLWLVWVNINILSSKHIRHPWSPKAHRGSHEFRKITHEILEASPQGWRVSCGRMTSFLWKDDEFFVEAWRFFVEGLKVCGFGDLWKDSEFLANSFAN